jgi:hypothetical protein
MANDTKRWQIGLLGLVMVCYAAVLLRNLHESERRSLQLDEIPIAGDYVGIALRIVAVNPATSEMTARISFRLAGNLAKDPATPAVDLKLLVNEIRGPQEIDFPRGRRINPIEAVFSLDGNVNQYPFDRYSSSIWMMVTKKPSAVRPSRPQTGKHKKTTPLETVGGLVLAVPQESEPLPIVSSIDASIPGLKVEGQSVERGGGGDRGLQAGCSASRQCDRGIDLDHGADDDLGHERADDEPAGVGPGREARPLAVIPLRDPALRFACPA